MSQTRSVAGCAWRWTTLAVAFSMVALVAVPASAAPHKARLSRDLADRVAAGREEPTSVIVSGTPDLVQALVARYGARLKKSLRGGAVLEVTGGQLTALSQDPDRRSRVGRRPRPADDGGDDGIDRRDRRCGAATGFRVTPGAVSALR